MKSSPKNQHHNDKGRDNALPIFVHSELDDSGLDPFEFRLYARIVRRAGKDGICYESIASMAAGCGMAEGTLKRRLRNLLSIGAIEKERRPGRACIYRPIPIAFWRPRSDITQAKRDPGGDLTDPAVDLIDPSLDLTDPPPRSDLPSEGTPLSSSAIRSSNQGIPNNDSSCCLSFVGEISSETNSVTTVVQAEEADRKEVSGLAKGTFSAPPSNWEDRVRRLGVQTHDHKLRAAVRDYPNNVDDAIAAMKEAIANGTQIRNPTRWLTAAIRDGYQPEKTRQTQPSVSPVPLDESQVPPPGIPEHRDWLENRTRNAPWRNCSSA